MHADKRMPQAHEDGGAGRSRSVMLTETLRRKRTSRKEAWFVYSPVDECLDHGCAVSLFGHRLDKPCTRYTRMEHVAVTLLHTRQGRSATVGP